MSKSNQDSQIKIIALLRRPSDFVSTFEQLKRRNLSFAVAHTVKQAVELAKSGVFQFCLMSVDFAGIEIEHHPQIFEKELNVPVIVISELRDRQSMSRLSKTKARNILYSKANAQIISARIDLMKKTAAEQAKKSAPRVKDIGSVRQIVGNQSTGTVQKKFLRSPPPSKTKIKITKQSTFKFLPKSDVQVDQPLSFEKFLSPQEQEMVQRSIERDVENSKRFPPQKQELPDYEPLAADDSQASVLTSLKNVLVRLGRETKQADLSAQFTSCLVISFDSASLKGTFVIGQQETRAHLNTIESELYLQLRSSGFEWRSEEVSVRELKELSLSAEFMTSGVYVSNFSEVGEVAITYYSHPIAVPKFKLPKGEEFEVLLRDLVEDSKLTFDLFINLKLNSRSLHYLKMGNVLSQKQIEKLRSGGIAAWIPSPQVPLYEQYVLYHRLMRLMKSDSVDDGGTGNSTDEDLKIA